MGPGLKFHFYINNEEFDSSKYGDESIKRESVLQQSIIQLSDTPAYIGFDIMTELLSDQSGLLQFGSFADTVFYTHNKVMDVYKSSWSKFPTSEDPHARYKFVSVTINVSPDQR